MVCIYLVQDDWQRKFAPWRIRTVLLPLDAPLAAVLRSRAGWKELYADSQAVILSQTDSTNR